MTPSRPAPSNSSNQRCAVARSVVAGVTCIERPVCAAEDTATTSAARRSENGRAVKSTSPSASRSNAMNEAGVFSASMRTRDSAGWMRCCSASKSRPWSVAMTISPSTTQRSGNSAMARGNQLGKVPGHRFLVAAADLDLVAVAKKNRPEPVPLGLIRRVRRDRFHRLGQHRRNRRHHRQVHLHIVSEPCAGIGRWHRQRRKSTSTGSRFG